MKKFFLSAVVLSLFLFALSFLAPSVTFGGVGVGKGKKSVDDTYVVVKVTDENKVDNKVEYRVVASSRYKDEEKRIRDSNLEKMNEWLEKKKHDPQAPKPQKVSILKIGTKYKIERIAQEYAKKLTEEELDKDAQKPRDNRT